MKTSFKVLLIAFLLCSQQLYSQTDPLSVEKKIDSLTLTIPNLNKTIDLSVDGVSLQDFCNSLSEAGNINLSCDPNLSVSLVNRFKNIPIRDVLVFLCKTFDLDIEVTGSILYLKKQIKTVIKPEVKQKEISIEYNPDSQLFNVDLVNDTLSQITKKLSKITLRNFILMPGTENKTVSLYLKNCNLGKVVDAISQTGNFKYRFDKDSSFVMELGESKVVEKTNSNQRSSNRASQSDKNGVNCYLQDDGSIKVEAINAPLFDIIDCFASKKKINYSISNNEIKGNATFISDVSTFDSLLFNIFRGTQYTYSYNNNGYSIGERQSEGLRETKMVRVQYRTVEKIAELIPAEMKKNVEIKEYLELNGLILSGSKQNIAEIESFIYAIDKVVPVILIEVIIMDVKKTIAVSTGVSAGLGDSPIKTTGEVFPNFNMQLNSTSINNLINSFNGFGWVNLGKVTPNFYLTLRAMEDNGMIEITSTPKLATLNSYESKLSIGNTEYYLEEQNTVIGSQNPQNIVTKQYKSVNADLSLTIKPFVSGDNQVTLKIEVTQSDFTNRISPNAPPGSVSRSFSSLIRVKDGELVLLGGLERKSNNSSGSGVPFLSRIPIIKWFFSSRSSQKEKSKLNIFIKTTIIN